MATPEKKHLIIIEFRTEELRKAYRGVTLDEHLTDNCFVLHVINEELTDDKGKTINEKIIRMHGLFTKEQIQLFADKVQESNGYSVTILGE